jgi:hypothetical protein
VGFVRMGVVELPCKNQERRASPSKKV